MAPTANVMKRITIATRKKLAYYKAVGCKFVEVFPHRLMGSSCAAVNAMDGKKIPIDEAKEFPLDGCDQKCQCAYMIVQERPETTIQDGVPEKLANGLTITVRKL